MEFFLSSGAGLLLDLPHFQYFLPVGRASFNMIPHLHPSGLAVLRWSSFSPVGRTFCNCLARQARGSQHNDCDATSWFNEIAKAVAKGVSKSPGSSFLTRPAITERRLYRYVVLFSFRDEFTPPREFGRDSDGKKTHD